MSVAIAHSHHSKKPQRLVLEPSSMLTLIAPENAKHAAKSFEAYWMALVHRTHQLWRRRAQIMASTRDKLRAVASSVVFVPVFQRSENKSHNMRNSSCPVRIMCEYRDVTKPNTMKSNTAQNKIWTGWMTRAQAFAHAKALAIVEGTKVELRKHCTGDKGAAGDYWATTWTW